MNDRFLEALSKLKKEVEDLKVQINTQKELVNTYRNDKLIDKYEIKDDKWYYNGLDTGKFSRGETGKAFTYEDFTPEQLEGLRGPKGDSFTFDDLTPEEIVLLTGADGLDGEPGKDGYTPIKGVDYFDGKDGKDGKDGLDGKDGETPELEIGEIKSVSTYDPAKVSLKKKKNKYIIDMDIPRGRPGANGSDGSNGISATINGVNTLNIEAGDNITLEQDGNTLTINSTGGGSGGTSDYSDLTNKPKINNIELNGNKSLNDLGIQPKGDYALKSEIPDVSNFITKAVNDLTNYYLKSETYTKTEVNTLISAIEKATFEVVNELPVTGESNVIYLVPSSNPKTQNVKDEYIWINNTWEQIGSTQVDLTGYATESWVNTQISDFLTETEISALISTALTGYAKTSDLPDLTNYVKNTDYASIEKGGVIKISPLYGVSTTNGVLSAVVLTGAGYRNANTNAFVSKGTLDGQLSDYQTKIDEKLDTSKVKNTTSTTAGDVYDVTYINTMLGNIESLLSEV